MSEIDAFTVTIENEVLDAARGLQPLIDPLREEAFHEKIKEICARHHLGLHHDYPKHVTVGGAAAIEFVFYRGTTGSVDYWDGLVVVPVE